MEIQLVMRAFLMVLLGLLPLAGGLFAVDIVEINDFESYNRVYCDLKKEESWIDIVSISECMLDVPGISGEQSIIIRHRLTSSCFYLGEYDKALAFAKKACTQATSDVALRAKSLYLLSAVYRVKARASPEHPRFASLCFSSIREALELVANNPVDDLTKAKVRFNAGAAYHDLKKDYITALSHYFHAKILFEEGSDDAVRVLLRQLRCLVESEDPNTARTEVDKISVNPYTRTGVQLQLLRAKIAYQLGDSIDALHLALEALPIASAKSMKAEVALLSEVIEQAKNILLNRV